MTAPLPDSTVDTGLLEPGETLLWQGPLGFNHASAPATVASLFLLAFFAFWATWGSQSMMDFCPPESSGRGCSGFYWLVPPILLIIALVQGVALLERRAVTSGQAHAAILLTNRRLIRLSHWPWRRIKAWNYLQTAPAGGMPGVIRFGPLGSMIVGPQSGMLIQRMRAVKAGIA